MDISQHQQLKSIDESQWPLEKRITHFLWDIYDKLFPWPSRRADFLYKLRCFIFRPYTTIKPRYLTHEWCGKNTLIPHLMFEVLSLFMEKEKPDEHIDWEWTKKHSKAWKEINALYKWWHEVYIPWTQREDPRYNTIERPEFQKIPGTDYSELVYSSKKAEAKARGVMNQITKEERQMHRQLLKNCKRLINVMDFLWT